jgi:ATP-dependent Clp protease ATP-binding subunit ClpA
MSRRLSSAGRGIIIAATHEAARLEAEETEPEHFLLALFTGPPSTAQSYLADHGLTRRIVEEALRDAADGWDITFDAEDTAALTALGFDLPVLLDRLEERFGSEAASTPRRRRPGPRRLAAGLSRATTQLIKAALLEAVVTDTAMGPEHLLLAILRDPTPTCADLAAAYDLDYDDARAYLFPPPKRNAG